MVSIRLLLLDFSPLSDAVVSLEWRRPTPSGMGVLSGQSTQPVFYGSICAVIGHVFLKCDLHVLGLFLFLEMFSARLLLNHASAALAQHHAWRRCAVSNEILRRR